MPQFRDSHPDILCDIVIVDGGHYDDVPYADIMNFFHMVDASKPNLLIVDDFPVHFPWAVAVEVCLLL